MASGAVQLLRFRFLFARGSHELNSRALGRFVPNIAMEDQKPLSEIRILILDYVQDTRTLLGTFLRAAGASTVESATAKEALTVLDRERFHVVLSDLEFAS